MKNLNDPLKKAIKRPINLQLFEEDYALLKSLAKQDQRSITNYVMVVLLKHIHERKKQQTN